MKLLYIIIIFQLIQLLAIKPLEASNDFNEFSGKIVQFYVNALKAIDKDFCEKAKTLSEKLLQDKFVQQAATPVMREFRQNVTDFLNKYSLHKHYDYNNKLVWLFVTKMSLDSSNNKDLQYISQLLERSGLQQLYDDYQRKFSQFVKQKFLPQFAALQKELNANELKQHEALLQWYNELKKCQDYACHQQYFARFANEQTTVKSKN